MLLFFFPKEKQSKSRSDPSSGASVKTLGAKKSQHPLALAPAVVHDNTSKSTLESSEAVTQLLNAASSGEQVQETEWEEVIISEAHILANNTQPEEQGNATTIIQFQEGTTMIDSALEPKEKDTEGLEAQPSTEVVSPGNSLANLTSLLKQQMG